MHCKSVRRIDVLVSIKISSLVLGPVHTTLGKFENDVFTLKAHQMFSVHTTPEKFDNATNTGHFGFVLEEGSGREIT